MRIRRRGSAGGSSYCQSVARRSVQATITSNIEVPPPWPSSPITTSSDRGKHLREPPGHSRRSADVQPAMDHQHRDVGDAIGVAEQLVVIHERRVAPVVGHQPGKAQAKARILVARTGLVAGVRGDVRVFPIAPRFRRRIVDRRIGVLQQPCVCGGQISVTFRRGDHVAKPLPLLGEHAAHRPRHPIDVGMRRR